MRPARECYRGTPSTNCQPANIFYRYPGIGRVNFSDTSRDLIFHQSSSVTRDCAVLRAGVRAVPVDVRGGHHQYRPVYGHRRPDQ